jgi:hypothetical protein
MQKRLNSNVTREPLSGAVEVRVTARSIRLKLNDGRSFQVPLSVSKRLLRATPTQRRNLRFIGKGLGMHWPDVDEDLSVDGLLAYSQDRENVRVAREWIHRGRGRPTKGQEIGSSVAMSVRVPTRVQKLLRATAKAHHMTVHAMVRDAIEAYLRSAA